MPQPIIWLHGDCLSPHHPAFQAYPGATSLWIWDSALLLEWRISLKRLVFIYECLLELPVTICRGDVVTEISKFAQRQGADKVVTSSSPSPRFKAICQQITTELGLEVEILEVEPFIAHEGDLDLKRFSRYWKVAQPKLFP
jgi:hypothetical protein